MDRLLHLRDVGKSGDSTRVGARRGPPATPQVGGVAGVVVMSLLHSMVGGRRCLRPVSAPAEDRLLHLRSAVSLLCRCFTSWSTVSAPTHRGPPATPQVGGVAATLMVGGVGACSGSPVAPRSLGKRWSSSHLRRSRLWFRLSWTRTRRLLRLVFVVLVFSSRLLVSSSRLVFSSFSPLRPRCRFLWR